MRADLALVGFGSVARRFSRLIEERRDWLSLDYELDCRVVGIATRRHGALFKESGLDAVSLAADVESGGALADESAAAADSMDVIRGLARSAAPMKVLVETTTLDITAGQPAIDHVRAALTAGCHVVTANKGPAAFAYEELSALAADRGCSFLFEGAVMDGVPIFNLVRETLPAVEITGFRGVINSTTNHILSALEDGEGFDAALERMQAARYRRGRSVARRGRLGRRREDRGAGQRAAARADDAAGGGARGISRRRRRGWRWRPRRAVIASAWSRQRVTTPEGVKTSVRPVELPETDLLAGLRGMANALVLQTDLLGEIAVCQLSGSLTQTAYALLSDVIAIRRRQQPAPHAAAPGRIP